MKGKKMHTEWKWVFGEMAWDIQVASFTGQPVVVEVVLQATLAAIGSTVANRRQQHLHDGCHQL